jgi:hypothetical protein
MLPGSYQVPAAVLLLVGGLVACFLGRRLFRVILGVYGFILGALVTTSVLAPTETIYTLLAAVGGGIVGALVLIAAYFLGVAFAGAALAALLVHLAWTYVGGEPHPLAVIAGCVLGALAAMALQDAVIVLGTAFGGAWTLLVGALALLGYPAAAGAAARGDVWLTNPLSPVPGVRWLPFAWILLGIGGAFVQFRTRGSRVRAATAQARRRSR